MIDEFAILDAAAAGQRFDGQAGPNTGAASQAAPNTAPTPAAPKKPNPVTVLTYDILAKYEIVRWQGELYAVNRDPSQARIYGPAGVAQKINAGFRPRIGRIAASLPSAPDTLPETRANDVNFQLKAYATDQVETALAIRFHQDAGRVVIDLGRDDRAIIITRDGWAVDTIPDDVIFRRTHTVRALPDPERGGTLDELAPLLALDSEGTREGQESPVFPLLVGWLLSLPFASDVRPGLLVVGAPGCGKSTRLRLLASVVEPSAEDSLGSSFGVNHDDDVVRAAHRAVPLWDNLHGVSQATSDLLCCLITGTARERRTLYSDGDLHSIPVKRAVGLTAVGRPAGLRQDALDRLIVVELPAITRRIADTAVQAAFDEAQPRLLGAVCDAVSAVLAYRDKVAAPTDLRLAAYGHVLASVDAAVADGVIAGCPAGLLDAYRRHLVVLRQTTAADDVFGSAVLKLLHAQPPVYGLDAAGRPLTIPPTPGAPWLIKSWTGTAAELKRAAEIIAAPTFGEQRAGWPTTERRVPEVLRHLQDGLAALGVTWTTRIFEGRRRYEFTLRNQADN